MSNNSEQDPMHLSFIEFEFHFHSTVSFVILQYIVSHKSVGMQLFKKINLSYKNGKSHTFKMNSISTSCCINSACLEF